MKNVRNTLYQKFPSIKHVEVLWKEYTDRVKERDQYMCMDCTRTQSDGVVLQVHHEAYNPKVAPHMQPLSDCVTLCKGCHAERHGLIQPRKNWSLITSEDLGGLSGVCNRETVKKDEAQTYNDNNRPTCNQSIRYAQYAYHQTWGYEVFGSTCITYLTKWEQDIVRAALSLKLPQRISDFKRDTKWEVKISKKGKGYIQAQVGRLGLISIYKNYSGYSFQTGFRISKNYYSYGDKFTQVKTKDVNKVKELAFIAILGGSSPKAKREVLRSQYKKLLLEIKAKP